MRNLMSFQDLVNIEEAMEMIAACMLLSIACA